MIDKVNYIDEVKRVKKILDNTKDNDAIIKLSLILNDLEVFIDDMASYITDYKDLSELDFLKQISQHCLINNDYDGYINAFKSMINLERIALICSTQMPDEKRYFLEEYAKYKESKKEKGISKVR